MACFKKKDTVSGIIGKTQGVNSASKPAIKPNKKIFEKELVISSESVFSNKSVFNNSSFNSEERR